MSDREQGPKSRVGTSGSRSLKGSPLTRGLSFLNVFFSSLVSGLTWVSISLGSLKFSIFLCSVLFPKDLILTFETYDLLLQNV